MNRENLNIKKNELLRQFEYRIDTKLIKVEYSEQGRNTFLTRFEMDKNITDDQLKDHFLKAVLDILSEKGTFVIPTCPVVARFFRNHRSEYKHLLPAGINL
jgi:predicted GNAT family acetyltransferase